MTPTFGFSVGDFISVVALITKVSKALKSTGGAASEYQHVCFELEALKGILERLATLQPDASNINQVNHIRATALGCQLPLQLFLQKIQKFETSLGASPSSKSLSGAVRKGQWAVFMTEEISRLRSEICAKMTIIHLSLVIHCSESLSRIEALNQELRKDSGIRMPELEEGAQSSIGTKGTVFQLQSISDINQGPQELAKEPTVGYVELNKPFDPTPENARALFTAVGTNCSSIVCPKQVVDRILEVVTALSVELRGLLKRILNTNLQVYTFLQNLQPNIARSPLLQQSDSIQFEDVLGRTKHLPYQFFRYWPMLVTYLQMEFRDLPGERLVNEGQYYIMDARSNGRSITDTEWERYVFPGAHVMMSMIVTSFLRGKGMCSRPNCTKRTQLEDSPSSMFQCPDCGTRYFPYPYSSFGFFSDQGDGVRDFEEWENFVGWVALKRADQNPDKSGAAAARDVMEEIKAFRRLHTPVEDGDWQPTAYPAESEPPSKLIKEDLTCTICKVAMPDKHTLILHQRNGHASPDERYRCPYQHHGNPKCRVKVFMRRYNLHRHLRHVHGLYKNNSVCMLRKERKELERDLDRGRELGRAKEMAKCANWCVDTRELKGGRSDTKFVDIGTSWGSVFYDV